MVIGVVLPARETFTLARSGAVALCARDFAAQSVYPTEVIGAGECGYSEVRYRRLTGWRRWWRRDRDAYAAAVAEIGADYALLEVQNRPYMMTSLRRRLPGVKLVLHLHNDPQEMDGSRSRQERAGLLRTCDAVYCVSDFIRVKFLAGLSDPEGRAVTIRNGAPMPVLRAKEKIIAFTGRMIAIKGVAELVRAFAAADLPDWRLVLAGGDADGLLNGLKGRFEALGQVSHAQALDLLARAEIAAAPSMWDDPCPRAAIEALAAGCALVTSRRGGLPEIAGAAGVFVEPGDISEFAAAFRRLARDDEFRHALQEQGRERAETEFDIALATARLDAARMRLVPGAFA